jgi:hypothetical protein
LREERRLRVFESRVLMRIFGVKGDEVTGEKMHNGLICTHPVIEKNEMGGTCSGKGDGRVLYGVLGET